MIDQELKKKIANTLSRYELKCDKMQSQINALKNVINQLILIPGVNYEKDEHYSNLQDQLEAEFDPIVIEKKVNRLAHIIEKLEKKKQEKIKSDRDLLRKGTESISLLSTDPHNQKMLGKLHKMLDSDMENHELLVHFNDALNSCVASVVKNVTGFKQHSDVVAGKEPTQVEISIKVNDSLQQLLNHLSIPEDLDVKREHIKVSLETQLTGDNLSKVIDGLTELVVDAFNVEQNRFKGFLQQLTNQLQDFDVFLKTASDTRTEASEESLLLEHGITEDINQIKSHLDTSKTIEELSSKIHQNLEMIGERIQEYRVNEKNRDEEYEKQVVGLQSKLSESEQNAEEIKNLLSFQKYRINHDSLTGLPNRESYDEHILESMHRWKRSGKVMSLAIGDVDHFKRINDTFGHLAGDKVLKKVALIFKSSIRPVDFIARFGGEEFVLIFEETTGTEAITIVENLRKSVEDCQFIYREKTVDVTVSFGLTTILEEDNIESLFMRADNAMYNAKNSGRNRVEIL